MTSQHSAPPGDLVYLSERKLSSLSAQLGVRTGSFESRVDIEGTGGVSAHLPPMAQVSAQATVRAAHTDPGKRERVVARQLQRVVRRLGGKRLPDLEISERVREAGWFRFHRNLRFGVGCDDSTETIKAFLAVDQTHVPRDQSVTGLLMNGSLAHVLPPYSTAELRNGTGSRSGSATGALFIWLDAVRRELEANPMADIQTIDIPSLHMGGSPRHPDTAISMYGLFSRDGWLDSPQFPQLFHGAPCEGVAQASFIAAGEETTVVMASPLYIRVRALPNAPDEQAQ
jgi:hypothetical protein